MSNLVASVITLVFVALIAYVAFWICHVLGVLLRLRLFGRTTTAKIVSRRWQQGRGRAHFVVFAYHPDDVHHNLSYQAEQYVSGGTFERLKEGTLVTTRYLPSTPSVARLAGKHMDNLARNIALIVGLPIGVLMLPYSVLAFLLYVAGEHLLQRFLK